MIISKEESRVACVVLIALYRKMLSDTLWVHNLMNEDLRAAGNAGPTFPGPKGAHIHLPLKSFACPTHTQKVMLRNIYTC